MQLTDLGKYSRITIQCHDNPDADAIASGYAMYKYFKSKGVETTFIYSGRFPLQKSDLKILVEKLSIPIYYRESFEGDIKGLLLLVDCQYGAGNVTCFKADKVAVIDHHQLEMEEDELCEIRPELGSCSTLCWKLLQDAGYDVASDIELCTAFYYGLFKDTGEFSEIYHPLDKDMQDALVIDKGIFSLVRNSNISRRELKTAGVALIRHLYNEKHHYAIIPCDEPCDPNVLGVISDFLLSVDGVDVCCVFNVLEDGYKLSVRSCIKEVKANELAKYICGELGSGGGHVDKAGGFILKRKYEKQYDCVNIESYVAEKMHSYFDDVEIMYANTAEIDVSGMRLFEKKELVEGYVKVTDVFEIGTPVTIRTLDGDEEIKVSEDIVLMIGPRGEVILSNTEKLSEEYDLIDETYSLQDSVAKATYVPKITNRMTSEAVMISGYAKKCMAKKNKRIYVNELDHYLKVFTEWNDRTYTLGEPGDYMTVNADNLHDIYVIDKEILGLTYDEVVD